MRASTGRVTINLHGTEWLRERERKMDIFIGLETSVGKRRKDNIFIRFFSYLVSNSCIVLIVMIFWQPSLESKLFRACL